MRRALWLTLLTVFGIPAVTFGQATSDSQTLQALLTEVRELRRDLRISLTRIQGAQILLFRLQTQQAAVTRASERIDEARSKLTETQDRQQHTAVDIKRNDETLNTEENLAQQNALREESKRLTSLLEALATEHQQRQTTEIDAEQQLKSEQDKLGALETQLDELVKSLSSPAERSDSSPR